MNQRIKPGYVYFGKSVRRDNTVREYAGSTTRSVKVRENEHIKEVNKTNSKTWVGRGKFFKVKSSFYSKNPRKAETTIKNNKKIRSYKK